MPIYRGTQKITPHRGDQTLSRVYRGNDLVWQAIRPHVIETIPGITHWLPMKGGYDDVRFPAGNLSSTISSYNRDTAVSFNSDFYGNNTLNTWGNSQTALTNLGSAWPSGGSIGAWFKMSSDQPNGGRMILHKYNGASNFTYELYLNADAAQGYCYAGAKIGGTWWDVRVTTPLINNGSWYFVYAEVVKDPFQPSTWTLRVRVYTTSGSATTNYVTRTGLSTSGFPSNDNLYIGGSGSGGTMMGEFDDVIVANRALSTSELAAIATAGRSDPDSGPKLYMKSGSMRTGTIPRSQWTTVGAQTIPNNMTARLAMHNLSWVQAKSASDRNFRIRTANLGELAITPDEGLTLHLDRSLAAGDIVYFEAKSNAGSTSYRTVTNGHWLIREL